MTTEFDEPACRCWPARATAARPGQWAEQQGYQFPVLSDFWPHGEVAKAYGVFNDALGCANRATFLIDKDGTSSTPSRPPTSARPASERYAEALAKL